MGLRSCPACQRLMPSHYTACPECRTVHRRGRLRRLVGRRRGR